jgi:hypothetical protein
MILCWLICELICELICGLIYDFMVNSFHKIMFYVFLNGYIQTLWRKARPFASLRAR